MLIARSASFCTSVVAIADLLPGTGSAVVLDTLAVLVIVVPFDVPAFTFTTTVKIEETPAAHAVAVDTEAPASR